MALWPLLIPFVWVLEIDSCGNRPPIQNELTGKVVLGALEVEAWLIVVPVLLVLILTPFIANRLRRLGARVWVHLLGFAAALFSGWAAGFAMFFTIFREREARGAGWLVLAAFFGAVLDALWRLGSSFAEWRRARRAPDPQ